MLSNQIKRISGILLAVCLGIVLLGCSSESSEPTPYEKVNTLPRVRLNLDKEVYEKEDDTFILTVRNESESEITYGVPFTVEVLQNEEWYKVEPKEEVAFIMIAHILSPGEEAEEELGMSHYEPFKQGHYRIVREIEGEPLTVEFQVR